MHVCMSLLQIVKLASSITFILCKYTHTHTHTHTHTTYQFVSGDSPLVLAVVGAPYLYCLVRSRAGQPLTVGAELYRAHRLRVPHQSKLEAVVGLLKVERGARREG